MKCNPILLIEVPAENTEKIHCTSHQSLLHSCLASKHKEERISFRNVTCLSPPTALDLIVLEEQTWE